MDCKLVLLTGGANREFVLEEGQTTVGRDRASDIQLMGQFVSRHHAELKNMSQVCQIADIKSSNGLFVNGSRVSSIPLKHGDEIRIGDHLLRFEQAGFSESQGAEQYEREYSAQSRDSTVRKKMAPEVAPRKSGGSDNPIKPSPIRRASSSEKASSA